MRISLNKFLKYLYIVSFCLAITGKCVYFYFPYYLKYIHCIIWSVLGLYYTNIKTNDLIGRKYSCCQKEIKRIFFSPYIIFLILSLLGFVYYFPIDVNIFSRCISNILQFGLMLMSVVYTSKLFKDKLLDYTFKSLVLNYLVIIFLTITKYGIADFIKTGLVPWGALADTWMDNASHALEVHDVNFAAGFFIIYYFAIFKEQKPKIKILLSVMIIYLGYKRIQLVALLFIGLVFKIIKSKSKRTELFWAFIVTITMLFASLGYIYVIKSDFLIFLALKYKVEFNGRIESYKYLSEYFTLLPSYVGKGIGAGTRCIEAINRISSTNIVSGHSDILYRYFDLGFWGFIIWIVYSFFTVPKRLCKRYSTNAVYLWLIFTLYAFITYFTDNTTMYFAFQASYMVVMLQVLYENKKYNV